MNGSSKIKPEHHVFIFHTVKSSAHLIVRLILLHVLQIKYPTESIPFPGNFQVRMHHKLASSSYIFNISIKYAF